MGQRGNNISPARRKLNLKNSRDKLEGLLAANFREGAQLVTLTYGEGARTPSRKLADLQVRDWLRAVRDKRGPQLRYIRATGWENNGRGCPVHRIVMAFQGASVASLADLWEHGYRYGGSGTERGHRVPGGYPHAPGSGGRAGPCALWPHVVPVNRADSPGTERRKTV